MKRAMKKIELAKTAGFCFGVNRAVEMTYELVNSGKKVSTLGPLIHNPVVIEDLGKKGVLPNRRKKALPLWSELTV